MDLRSNSQPVFLDELPTISLEWAVPGLRIEIIQTLLQALPKTLRRPMMPIPERAKEIVAEFKPEGSAFLESLARHLRENYRIPVTVQDWPADAFPDHLKPRYAVTGKDQKVLGTARDINIIKKQLESAKTPVEVTAWQKAVEHWEKYALSTWSFGDLPEKILISDAGNTTLYAYPGIECEGGRSQFKVISQARAGF